MTDDILLTILDAVARKWPQGQIKFLEDVKTDIAAYAKKPTGIEGFEFHDGDDAAITRRMDAQPIFERAAFGNPAVPSWKRR
jgi:hypothetical protein